MLYIGLITGVLLPVYLYVLLGTGAITLTLVNIIGVVILTALAASVVIAIAALSTYKRVK